MVFKSIFISPFKLNHSRQLKQDFKPQFHKKTLKLKNKQAADKTASQIKVYNRSGQNKQKPSKQASQRSA